MSHFLDRLNFFKKVQSKFSGGHGIVTNEDRQWEDGYRNRWRFDKVVRSTHGVNCTGSCSWNIHVKNFIFGAGINYFPIYIGEHSTGMSPHSTILELLSEYGIIGTFLFLSPVVYILLIRKSRLGTIYGRSVTEKLIFLLASYFWTMAMVTGGLRNSWVLIFFTFLLIPTTLKVRGKYTCNNSQIDYASDSLYDRKTAIKTA